jgi:hypothetical protein
MDTHLYLGDDYVLLRGEKVHVDHYHLHAIHLLLGEG